MVRKLLDQYLKDLYNYNSLISRYGFYLKPVHIVVRNTSDGKRRYYYYGRYWWKIEYVGKKKKTSKIRWRYVGREKPRELSGIPDPPRNPFEGLVYQVRGEDIIISKRVFERFKWLFRDNVIEECRPQQAKAKRVLPPPNQ